MTIASSQPVFSPTAGRPADAPWARAAAESVVQQFANATERDARWTSVPEGAICSTVSDHATWRYNAAENEWQKLAVIDVDVSNIAGEIKAGIFTVAPVGWLLMNGASHPGANTAYPNLWAVAPAAWKSGTTLTIPNMSGRVLEGGGTVGAVGGLMTHVLTEANLAPHDHTITHTHTINHTHASFTTPEGGGHSHEGRYMAVQAGTGAAVSLLRPYNAPTYTDVQRLNVTGDTGALHSHAISVPGFSGNSGPSSAANSGSAGSATAVDHTPAHLRVNYIIRT